MSSEHEQTRDKTPGLPRLLNDQDLAARWRCSVRTLQRGRAAGAGPVSIRIGRTVHYREEDILAHEDGLRRAPGGLGND